MTSRRNFLGKVTTSLPLISLTPLPSLESGRDALTDLSRLDSTESEEEYWKMVRNMFSLKKGQTYFNNGTLGPVPDFTLNRMIDDMRTNAVYGAETDYKSEGPQLLTGYFEYKELRQKVGKIINADYPEMVLTQNATFGMNLVANGLDLKKGDEIINTDQEHGGGFGAWRLLAKRKGCVYKMAEMPVPANDPQEIIDSIFSQVTKKTRVIAIPHIISVYGVVMPVKQICEEARKLGIFTVLDGAQCVGQVAVDVKDIGCDAYYSSLHKWLLAPAGNGILYINKDVIPDIWTTMASYQWDNQEDHGFRLMQSGTGNTSVLAGLDASIDFYNSIGPEKWLSRIRFLGDYLRDGLKGIEKVTIHSSTHPDMCAGITTYSLEGISGPDLQRTLWERERLQPRSVGEEMVRHSVHIYNNEEEIDRALSVMRSL